MSEESVTIVISRVVRPGHEVDFERAVGEWLPKSTQFPGHLGALLIHPQSGGQEYGAVIRFRTLEHWFNFKNAPEYQAFLDEIRPCLLEEPRVETATGLEAWFRGDGTHVPPRWKMALVTWLGVCLTTGILGIVLGPYLSSWPWIGKLLTMNAVVVVALTWLVMPVVVRVAKPWLRRQRGTGSKE